MPCVWRNVLPRQRLWNSPVDVCGTSLITPSLRSFTGAGDDAVDLQIVSCSDRPITCPWSTWSSAPSRPDLSSKLKDKLEFNSDVDLSAAESSRSRPAATGRDQPSVYRLSLTGQKETVTASMDLPDSGRSRRALLVPALPCHRRPPTQPRKVEIFLAAVR